MKLCGIVGLVAVAVAMTLSVPVSRAADAKSDFASTTIDLGSVVEDAGKSIKFYTEALGFKELPSFSAPAEFCADAGLTDHKDITVRVLALGDGPAATKLKLIQLPGVSSKKSDNGFIHSQFGYRYITLHVADMDAAVERLKKAGVKPIAKGPVKLPAGFPAGMALTVVRDPDGNFIELVGPKK